MTYEIINEDLNFDENNPIHFLKWATKYNVLDGNKIKSMNMNDFYSIFPFSNSNDKNDAKLKNIKNSEFPLAWFKEKKIKYTKNFKIIDDEKFYFICSLNNNKILDL